MRCRLGRPRLSKRAHRKVSSSEIFRRRGLLAEGPLGGKCLRHSRLRHRHDGTHVRNRARSADQGFSRVVAQPSSPAQGGDTRWPPRSRYKTATHAQGRHVLRCVAKHRSRGVRTPRQRESRRQPPRLRHLCDRCDFTTRGADGSRRQCLARVCVEHVLAACRRDRCNGFLARCAGRAHSFRQNDDGRFPAGVGRFAPVSVRRLPARHCQSVARTGKETCTLQEPTGKPGQLRPSRCDHRPHRVDARHRLSGGRYPDQLRRSAGLRPARPRAGHPEPHPRRHRGSRLSADARGIRCCRRENHRDRCRR